MPPDVAAFLHRHGLFRPLIDDDVAHERQVLHRFVHRLLQGNKVTASKSSVRGDDHLAVAVLRSVLNRLRTEAREDHAVNRSDSGAGQHGDRKLGDRRQVDRHAVSALDSAALQHVSEPIHLPPDHLIRQHPSISRFSLPDDRGLVPSRGVEVAIQAILRDVDLAADEPLGERRLPLEDLRPLLDPHQFLGSIGPVPLRIGGGFAQDLRIVDPGVLAERLRWRVLLLFLQEAIDRRARNDQASTFAILHKRTMPYDGSAAPDGATRTGSVRAVI